MPLLDSPTDDDDDRKNNRAKIFFDRGDAVADTGNFDYAIEMYIQGLCVDPDNIAAHAALRRIALRRTAAGGRAMGMLDRMKLPKPIDDEQAMLNAEKLLAYGPANLDRMRTLYEAATVAGCPATAEWIKAIFDRAMDELQDGRFG